MADNEEPEVSAETEQEIRDAMNQGVHNAANDSIRDLARITRRYYINFRAQGFNRRQATTFTLVVFQKLVFGN